MPNTGLTGTGDDLGHKIHLAMKQTLAEYGNRVNEPDTNVIDDRAERMWQAVGRVIVQHILDYAYVEVGSPATADGMSTVPLPEAPSVLLSIPTHTHTTNSQNNVLK